MPLEYRQFFGQFHTRFVKYDHGTFIRLDYLNLIVHLNRSRIGLFYQHLTSRFFSRSKSVYVVNNASGLVSWAQGPDFHPKISYLFHLFSIFAIKQHNFDNK